MATGCKFLSLTDSASCCNMHQMAQISGTNTVKHLREIAVQLVKEIAKERVRGEPVVPSDALLSVLHAGMNKQNKLFPHKAVECGDWEEIFGAWTSLDLPEVLRVVFPQTLQHALDLVDRNCVTKVVSPSGRELFQVKGSSGKIYDCLISSEFCTCPSYTYYVLKKEDILMCKHVLAVYIAQNLRTLNERKVSDKGLTEILTSADDGCS